VASLYEHVMRSGSRIAPEGLPEYFERTFLDHPWFDPEIPSLVHADSDGKIVGFLGSHVRRMRFDGDPIRLACSGQLVVDPSARSRAIGALLMRRYFTGAQDMTITDGATETVRRMWDLLGGEAAALSCVGWSRVFRPWRVSGDSVLARLRLGGLRPLAKPLWSLLDAVTVRAAGHRYRPPAESLEAEPLTPEAMLDQLAALAEPLRLHPDYDRPFLEWLFAELRRVTERGRLVAHMVRSDGVVLGWYIYYLCPRGVSQVVQLAATDDGCGGVLDHLFHHAESHGSIAVSGRLEPRLVEPLASRRAKLAYSSWALVHARDPEILSVASSRRALLTRLEGEWWMGHHLERFDG
jgi:GNAT superfamily N-acetyltransferase